MSSLEPYREKWREVPGGDDVDKVVLAGWASTTRRGVLL